MSRIETLLNALLNGDTANIKPRSRIEVFLSALLTGTTPNIKPQSRAEAYLATLCANGGSGSGGSAPNYLYYSKRTLTFAEANTQIRLTLPYEDTEAIYRVTCKQVDGSDVSLTITDWTTSTVIHADETAHIRMPSGDKNTTGKILIFAVYPGTQSGTYEITVERTAATDAYTGEIQVDFAAATA